MKTKFILSILFLFTFLVFTSSAEAHRDGCHAAHSCPSDTGSYVCGDTGNFSECGGSAPAQQSAPVNQVAAPTTASVKQIIVPTAIPTKILTSTPTPKPTEKPTSIPTPTQKPKVVPTVAVAGDSTSGNPVGGFITMGILGGLGYLGYKKIKNRKSKV